MLKDILDVNKEAIKKTFNNIKYIPILAIVVILFRLAEGAVLSLLSGFNAASSFILGFARAIVSIGFLSALVSILADIVLYDRFRLNNFSDRFSEYFNPLMSVYFFIFIAEYIINFAGYSTNGTLSLILTILLSVITSFLYEEVYIANNAGFDAISETLNFLKENILHVLPILLIYVFLERVFTINYRLFSFSFDFIIETILSALGLAFTYLYKGHLFNILNGSSVRKRDFQRKF